MIKEPDRQPERQARIRRDNVRETRRRHDWAYRWESVLKIAGLDPMPGLLQRNGLLKSLADMVGNKSKKDKQVNDYS